MSANSIDVRSTIEPPISAPTMSKYSIPAGTSSAVEGEREVRRRRRLALADIAPIEEAPRCEELPLALQRDLTRQA
ncbi:MAG: hypothetical protein WAL38_16040 [Solirubrobacteraceae bacterium]